MEIEICEGKYLEIILKLKKEHNYRIILKYFYFDNFWNIEY